MQLAWDKAGRKGFVTKVSPSAETLTYRSSTRITGVAETHYRLMQNVLDQSWEWELRDGEYKRWISFVASGEHHLSTPWRYPHTGKHRIHFWPHGGQCVAIAPLFEENLPVPIVSSLCFVIQLCSDVRPIETPVVASKSLINTPHVSFALKHASIHLYEHDGQEPDTDIFLCMVAQGPSSCIRLTR